jgi:hypothetical protein
MKKGLYLVVLAALMTGGCGKKAEKVTLAGFDRYQDPYFSVHFNYPRGWQVFPSQDKISVYSIPEVADRFYAYSPEGKDGAMLMVSAMKMDTLKSLDKIVNGRQSELSDNGFVISEVKAQSLGGAPGMLLHYSGAIDAKTRVEGLQISAVKDSFVYSVKYEGFNKVFASCQTVFDTVLATIKLPEPKSKKTTEADLAKPSSTFTVFENNFLKISHPDNFEPEFPKPKPPADFALDLKGYRQDCTVHVDILPAKGLTLDKVIEQNAKLFKEQSRGEAQIDGQRSVYINYSPVAGIQSRVYFTVKNDKIYRIIMNYYAPMKADYLPAFEKVATSLAAK